MIIIWPNGEKIIVNAFLAPSELTYNMANSTTYADDQDIKIFCNDFT